MQESYRTPNKTLTGRLTSEGEDFERVNYEGVNSKLVSFERSPPTRSPGVQSIALCGEVDWPIKHIRFWSALPSSIIT